VRAGAVAGESRVEVTIGDHLRQRRPFRDIEEDKADAFDEGDGDDVPERHRVERNRQGEAGERRATRTVSDDHHAFLIPAIDQRARRHSQDEQWQIGGGRHDSGSSRRSRRCEHEERKRDRRDVGTEVRDDLPYPKQVEVAVAAEWAAFACCVHCAGRTAAGTATRLVGQTSFTTAAS
jgi:hypothetical protein